MSYFRFQRSFGYVCSECVHNADVNAYNEKSLVEVEIKISKSDFKHEFDGKARWKTYKHKKYNESKKSNSYIVPNQFYFCVPIEMKEWALNYLDKNYDKYGLMVYNPDVLNGRYHIHVIKTAKKLHTNKQGIRVLRQLVSRMSSELITAKQKLKEVTRELECIKEGIITEE